MDHLLNRDEGGKGIEGWIQPVCSCGWVGRKEYAHNDYQHSNVRDQEETHIELYVGQREQLNHDN